MFSVVVVVFTHFFYNFVIIVFLLKARAALPGSLTFVFRLRAKQAAEPPARARCSRQKSRAPGGVETFLGGVGFSGGGGAIPWEIHILQKQCFSFLSRVHLKAKSNWYSFHFKL